MWFKRVTGGNEREYEWVDEAAAAAGGVHDKKNNIAEMKTLNPNLKEEVQLQVHAH